MLPDQGLVGGTFNVGTSLGPSTFSLHRQKSRCLADTGGPLNTWSRASPLCNTQLMDSLTRPQICPLAWVASIAKQALSRPCLVTARVRPKGDAKSEFTCKCSRGTGSRAFAPAVCQSAVQPGTVATCRGGEKTGPYQKGAEVAVVCIPAPEQWVWKLDRQMVVGIGLSQCWTPTNPCPGLHERVQVLLGFSHCVGEMAA